MTPTLKLQQQRAEGEGTINALSQFHRQLF